MKIKTIDTLIVLAPTAQKRKNQNQEQANERCLI